VWPGCLPALVVSAGAATSGTPTSAQSHIGRANSIMVSSTAFRAGRFPVDRLIRFYSFDDINHAAHEAEQGIAIKPVLRVASESRGVQSHE